MTNNPPPVLTPADIVFLKDMRREWEGSTRLGCWFVRVFMTLGGMGMALAGIIAGLRALGVHIGRVLH